MIQCGTPRPSDLSPAPTIVSAIIQFYEISLWGKHPIAPAMLASLLLRHEQ